VGQAGQKAIACHLKIINFGDLPTPAPPGRGFWTEVLVVLERTHPYPSGGDFDQNLCFLGVNPPLPLPGGDFRTEVLVVPRITLLYPSRRELSAEL
jgi:hypothetical protein